MPEEHQADTPDTDDDSDEDSDADSDDGDTGPDRELALIKFTELRTQYDTTRNSIVKNGREHPTTKEEIEKLSESSAVSAWYRNNSIA
ncbi:RNA polymerase sigma factor RpoD [Alishewanella longhuensis]